MSGSRAVRSGCRRARSACGAGARERPCAVATASTSSIARTTRSRLAGWSRTSRTVASASVRDGIESRVPRELLPRGHQHVAAELMRHTGGGERLGETSRARALACRRARRRGSRRDRCRGSSPERSARRRCASGRPGAAGGPGVRPGWSRSRCRSVATGRSCPGRPPDGARRPSRPCRTTSRRRGRGRPAGRRRAAPRRAPGGDGSSPRRAATRSPSLRSAARLAPRATNVTSCPPRASRAPK